MPPETPASPALGSDGFPLPTWRPPAADGTPPAQAAQAAAVVAAKAAPEVRYLSGRPRSELVDLVEPVAVDGVEIRQVEIRRLSTGQVNDFVDMVRSAAGGAGTRFPLFYRIDGAPLSDDEWNALDPDDADVLSDKGERFLPERFRSGRTSAPSSPPEPDTSGSSSAASPASA